MRSALHVFVGGWPGIGLRLVLSPMLNFACYRVPLLCQPETHLCKLEVLVFVPVGGHRLLICRAGGHPIPVFLGLIGKVSVPLFRVRMRFDWQSVAPLGLRVVLRDTPLVRA
jgi:hypothetical protein